MDKEVRLPYSSFVFSPSPKRKESSRLLNLTSCLAILARWIALMK